MPEEVDDDTRADRIVTECLKMVEDGVKKLSGKLEPDELVQVANVARAVSAIRSRPRKPGDERSYEDLLEQAKKYPDLMAALGQHGDE